MRQFRLPYDLVVVDLEANQPSNKIIEIGAVKVTRDGSIHPNQFSSFVYLDEPLNPEVAKLTGISEMNLINLSAPNFSDAMTTFKEWALSESKNIVLASWGNWDIPLLRSACRQCDIEYPFRGKSIDIKSIAVWVGLVTGIKTGGDGLGTVIRAWNLEFVGPRHRATADAWNTANLFLAWWKFYRETGEAMLKCAKKLGMY